MTGLSTPPEETIKSLQRLLREGYGAGFPVLKELLQNADDAGARRLHIVAHPGFPEATNPLLQAPALIVANDGRARKKHVRAMAQASGGSKSGEASTVGRFGLGQKAVFHLCDAFVVHAWLEDRDIHHRDVINPFEEVEGADAARLAWKDLAEADEAALAGWATAHGFDRGVVLVLPLRSSTLRPGSYRLADDPGSAQEEIARMQQSPALAATLACLRSLETVTLGDTRMTITPRAGRLSSPDRAAAGGAIGVRVAIGPDVVEMNGHEARLPDGAAMALKTRDDWPTTFNIQRQEEKEEAEPHGAVLIARRPVTGTDGVLRIHWAAYLPVGTPLHEEMRGGLRHDVDVLLHGHFFPRSDRTAIEFAEDIRGHWNAALRDEATLPLLLPALAGLLPSLGDTAEQRALVRAIEAWPAWAAYRQAACRDMALALAWNGTGTPQWRVVPGDRLRPVPADLSIRQLEAAWPKLADWLTQRGLWLAFGLPLAAQPIVWPDAELAKLIGELGASVFTRGQTPATAAAIVGHAPGTTTRDALRAALRLAMAGDAPLASDNDMRRLTPVFSSNEILRLPATIEHRDILRALAQVPGILPLRSGWVDDGVVQQPLSMRTTIALLAAIEPLLGRGTVTDQVSTAVSHLFLNGASPADLAGDPEAAAMRVIPVTRLRDRASERLAIGTAAAMATRGTLFAQGPRTPDLFELADAVVEPAVYQMTALKDAFPDLPTVTKANLLRVVRQATEFGSGTERGKLARRLEDTPDRAVLRSLVAGDPNLPHDARLGEPGGIDPVLEPVLALLSASDERLVIVEQAATRDLGGTQKTEIGIERLDTSWLAGALRDADIAGTMPALTHEQATALLASGVDHEVLRPLPLHLGDDRILHPAAALVRARAETIPQALRAHVRLLDLWGDPRAVQAQNALVADWSDARQIAVGLATDEPTRFVDEIMTAAVSAGTLEHALCDQLRTTRWLPTPGGAVAPGDLLDLPDQMVAALRALPGGGALHAIADLSEMLRDESRLAAMHRHGVLPDRKTSLERAADFAGACRISGPAAGADLSDWRMLARNGIDLPASGWRLLATALRMDDDAAATIIANKLDAPVADGVIAQLNAVAEIATLGQVGEAARRIHSAIFTTHVTAVAPQGWLPPALLVPSETGTFARADMLALDAEGVDAGRRLERSYRARLPKGVDARPASTATVDGVAVGDFADAISQHLERRRMLLDENAALLLFALLGRDARIAAHAARWRGTKSFNRLCDEIDVELARTTGSADYLAARLRKIRWSLRETAEGHAPVRAASGDTIDVPLAGAGAWLIDYHRHEKRVGPLVLAEHVELVVSARVPDADMAETGLVRQFVGMLLRPLQLQFNDRGAPLLTLLDDLLAGDPATLGDLRTEVSGVIHERLRQFRHAPRIKQALARYDETPMARKNEAQAELWTLAQSAEVAPELLDAVRARIADMGYADDRVLFELFQNADDAHVSHRPSVAEFRVIVDTEDELITRLRIVHHGRPINTAGNSGNAPPGYRRDLANMIAIGHSEKEDDTQTGRFGLGFKTVHMLSDDAGIASGAITTRISGGMIPLPWPSGIAAAMEVRDTTGHDRPTLIDLPIAPDRAHGARRALDAFRTAAPWLAAIAPNLTTIRIDDKRYDAVRRSLTPGITVVTLGSGRRMLELSLKDGFRLFLAFGAHGPEHFDSTVRQFWHLVPLDGIGRHGDWLMEGRFTVDPGRTKLNGSAEQQEAQFARLGGSLGERLIALHDLIGDNTGWRVFAEAEQLAADGREAFWRKLVFSFGKDVRSTGPEAALHRNGGGLARLLDERPLVPLAMGGFARAGEVAWNLTGALAAPEIRAVVAGWPNADQLIASAVDPDLSDLLAGLGRQFGSLALIGLLARCFPDGLMSPTCATAIAPLLTAETLTFFSKAEEDDLRRFLREATWLAEDGGHYPIRVLSFPVGDREEERQRAAFAPPSGRLVADYTGPAHITAVFAREQAGYSPDVWRSWIRTAGASEARQQALLIFLVGQGADLIRDLLGAADWLPPLASWPLLLATPGHRSILAAMEAGEETAEDAFPVFPFMFPSPEPATALEAIAVWWDERGPTLAEKYDDATYPEGFHPSRALLRGDDERAADEAWFTMLALASFQTLGRIQPEQSRAFLMRSIREGWWRNLATVHEDDDLTPFHAPLDRWSAPEDDEQFMLWRRCLIDLCRIARFLPDYRKLFLKLPTVIRREGPLRLGNYLVPLESAAAAKLQVTAPSIIRSLGMGANWLVRELSRHHVYTVDEAAAVASHAWGTVARIRRLIGRLGHHAVPGIDGGRDLHLWVAGLIGEDRARFGGAMDLPLHIITTAEYSHSLDEILRNAASQGWSLSDADDD